MNSIKDFIIMNLQATKIELIEMLINTKKPNVLKKIKEILVAQQNGLTSEDYKIIDARRVNHLNGMSESFSWKEASIRTKRSHQEYRHCEERRSLNNRLLRSSQ